MRYPCLVLDHDDTTVNSTATIHYGAFIISYHANGGTGVPAASAYMAFQ